jgi:hypothetical protein
MLSSALSMPGAGIHRPDKSHQSQGLRSKSQPPTENRPNYLLPSSPQTLHPMKTFFENLLHLTPHRYISTSSTIGNRAKLSSSLSTNIPSDRSSRIRVAHPSLVSSLSIRSTTENRVLNLLYFFCMVLCFVLASPNKINLKISSRGQVDFILNLLV